MTNKKLLRFQCVRSESSFVESAFQVGDIIIGYIDTSSGKQICLTGLEKYEVTESQPYRESIRHSFEGGGGLYEKLTKIPVEGSLWGWKILES